MTYNATNQELHEFLNDSKLHMYLNCKAQAELEILNGVKACDRKLIEKGKRHLMNLEDNHKDLDLGKLFNKKSFFYLNNGKTYQFPTRFTSDSEADRTHRVKYQALFIEHYEMFKHIAEVTDEETLEGMARGYSAKEPHFTGFDGDGYK